jgi:putative ABC transport system ATP-binding protein
MKKELIVMKGVEKVYQGKGEKVRALKGINLTILEGEFAAIAGPSGSGKTTLLNLIGALDKPTSGKIFFLGKEISSLNQKELATFRRKYIGFIFQHFNLIPVLTVEENVEYVLLLQKIGVSERIQKVRDVLEKVGLKGLEKRFPPQLSGGQQQRVAIARAIVHKPKIVLADEPTANLDTETGKNILKLMKKLNKEKNITFLFSTHDPLIMQEAERLILLRDGEIVEEKKNF